MTSPTVPEPKPDAKEPPLAPDESPPPSPTLLPCPALDVRWVHAGAQHLDMPIAPITTTTTAYKSFSADESRRIEDKWITYPEEQRKRIIAEWAKDDGELSSKRTKGKEGERRGSNASLAPTPRARRGSNASTLSVDKDSKPHTESVRSGEEQPRTDEVEATEMSYKDILAKVQQEYDDLELIKGVPVSQDSLFEVDLDTLSLHPVFWAHTGPRVPVLRGTWFVTDETRPCTWELAMEIERGYSANSLQPSYKHELATAMSLGPASEEKLKFNLPPRFGQGLGVIFEDDHKGRLITNGTLTYLSRALWSSLRTKPGGTYVYRGFSAAADASPSSTKETDRRGRSDSTASRRDSISSARSASRPAGKRPESVVLAVTGIDLDSAVKEQVHGVREKIESVKKDIAGTLDDQKRQALEEENVPMTDSSVNDPPCTDLVLVIHGIGQQLAAQYESYNFVYASNQLRQIIRKQSINPALASIIRERRCQVLPVQWRASLKLEPEGSEENIAHEMDNRFTMADITISKSIPYVRELTNSVLLDIPLFMSHHRQKMIEAVCLQANKLYRLWIARHPGFEHTGRVHIVGHSLGSALAAHILSNQPTRMPKLSQLPRMVITQTRDRFLFNTSDLFLCGSPLGIFLHLDQAQLMPRKGRERTMNSPQDEAIERAGKFGCMSIDSLYNIFYYTDPIAYTLNAAVDVKLAALRPPLAITSVTAPFFSSVSDSIGSISKYLPSYLGGGTTEKKEKRPGAIRLPSGLEMIGPSGAERLRGTRGERRFSALNPHGNVDFYLPGSAVSDYLDMITAHANYWSDPSFAAFLLAEIFSTRLDLMRTGMGVGAEEGAHTIEIVGRPV
ncbi:hypothetical protein Q5752_004097 [Cryptotrichosporon argae]